MPAPKQPQSEASEAERLKFQLEDLQRKLDAQARETRAKDDNGRRLEQRFRDLSAQIRDLEQRAGAFHREAAAAAVELKESEETLKTCDLARGQLSAGLTRQTQELGRWREQARQLKARIEELEAQGRRREDALERMKKQYEDACKLLAESSRSQADMEKRCADFEVERAKLLETVRRERESAEAVRREGIEALEESQEMQRRTPLPKPRQP